MGSELPLTALHQGVRVGSQADFILSCFSVCLSPHSGHSFAVAGNDRFPPFAGLPRYAIFEWVELEPATMQLLNSGS